MCACHAKQANMETTPLQKTRNVSFYQRLIFVFLTKLNIQTINRLILLQAKFIIQLERGLNNIPYLKSREDECLIEFPIRKKNVFQKILDVLYFGSKIDAVDGGNEDDEHELHEMEINLEDHIEQEIEHK